MTKIFITIHSSSSNDNKLSVLGKLLERVSLPSESSQNPSEFSNFEYRFDCFVAKSVELLLVAENLLKIFIPYKLCSFLY